MTEFKSWFEKELSNLLGFFPEKALFGYILSFENPSEIRDVLSSLIDINDDKNKLFIDDFFKRWNPPSILDNNIESRGKAMETKSLCDKKNNATSTEAIEDLNEPELSNRIPFREKSKKFVSLYSADGKLKSDTVILPGRQFCQCQAQKHNLVNNCVECGRVVCVQEGAGPCLFCNNLVCSSEDMQIISRDSKKGKKLLEKLMKQTSICVDNLTLKDPKQTIINVKDFKMKDLMEESSVLNDSLEKAVLHKDKLLHFDRNSTDRMRVIDDEGDYFPLNDKWLDKELKVVVRKQEAELDRRRSKSRRDKKFTLDFARKICIEDVEIVDPVNYVEKEYKSNVKTELNILANPQLKIPPLQFQYRETEKRSSKLDYQNRVKTFDFRLQDRGLQEMNDQGVCLSIHQPWASFFVHGIKRLEGRKWYTAHRGRLWIASTVKVPHDELVATTQNQYKELYPEKSLRFPTKFPIGVLLGCVNVADCLSNEEYYSQHPFDKENNESPYLIVCENSECLKVELPVNNKHRIYSLEKHIHAQARNLLVA